MAIEGFFRSIGRSAPGPYVNATIVLPRLGVEGDVTFLIDTGSDTTCLHPGDIEGLGIDYRELLPDYLTPYGGIGGSLGYYQEPGVLFFELEDGRANYCPLVIYVCESTEDSGLRGIPSLLGRDFLNLCTVYLDSAVDAAQLQPRSVLDGVILPA